MWNKLKHFLTDIHDVQDVAVLLLLHLMMSSSFTLEQD